ncbi:hypothetical protein A2164_02370 [Candidatus Curtissbacteria bacterium RBG_13_35_7]|uniref:Antitoxin n=1 Tax=Candidatus Curtissbacteria bacterium RBG_13_35_7 TaxID=1797705 RepID=A0A1F5G499_9BACT|nr:MAG: hypothetical protein A2164_02370 [Candidatus Curtissbacteria bacterium RBG_13_35_7]
MSNTVSATELKNKVADILNHVVYTKSETIIEKHGKPVAKIVPIGEKSEKDIALVIDRYFGVLPDFPDVTKFRRSRRRKIPSLL